LPRVGVLVRYRRSQVRSVTTSGDPHVEMREYLDALIAQADLKISELNGETVPLVIEEAA
jgi:hypothetical protein